MRAALASVAGLSFEALASSNTTVTLLCWRRIDAGTFGVNGPSNEAATASALRSSGTLQMICLD